jgi:hypothetical protein
LHGRRPGDFGQILDDFAGWDALLLHGARYPGHLRQEHDVFTPLKLSGVSWPYKKVAVQEDDTIPQSTINPDRLGDRRDFVHELGSDSGEFMSRKRLLITLVT